MSSSSETMLAPSLGSRATATSAMSAPRNTMVSMVQRASSGRW
ncbi:MULTISPECIES: hypothetical protein [unclassified Streptomyces]|nr:MULTISPECIES: hypothetical protein [unclassified Streptomyces]MCX5053993.1 hypothetical protein [Streptomyces sp. NBC_00474]MCX5060151.1 hypothetical protein [Streptomyces sp. NBC_00452]MCX5252070.1 hypothetical protein [Streptomyces sp. NBC_00201]